MGRDAELHQLDAGAEAGRHLLVVGDAGVGKSTLVAEWVAGRRGLHLEGRCAPLTGAMPLLPVIDALGSRHADVRPAVARALSGLNPSLRAALRALLPQHDLPGDGAETAEEELFLAIGELLAEMADARPVVLVVEDVHWADPKTNAAGGNWEGFDSDREQAVLDAEHHHWSRQPADAYEAALSGLHHLLVVEAALEPSLCGGLLTLAMRACADVAETARRDRDPAGVDDAVGRRMTIEGLRRRFVDEFDEDPFRPRDTIAPIR